MDFGQKLKKLRKEKNLRQKDLAELLNISVRAVAAYENEQARPRYRNIYEKLVQIFQVDMAYLLTDEQDFVLSFREQYGQTAAQEAESLVSGIIGLFAGGKLQEKDKKAVLDAIQEAYYESKIREEKKEKKS